MWQFYSGSRILTPYEGHVFAEAAAALVEVPPAEFGEDRECDGVDVETYAERLRAKILANSPMLTFFSWGYTQQVAALRYMLDTMLAKSSVVKRTYDMDICLLVTLHTMGLKITDYLIAAAAGELDTPFAVAYQRAYDNNRDPRLMQMKMVASWKTAVTQQAIDRAVLAMVFTLMQYYCGDFAMDHENAERTGILKKSPDYFVTPAPDCREEEVPGLFEDIISHLLEVK